VSLEAAGDQREASSKTGAHPLSRAQRVGGEPCVRAGITFRPSGEGKTFHDRFNYTPIIAAPPPPRISNKKH